MGKSWRDRGRRDKGDDDDETRLRIMEQKAAFGRLPTAPPGHIHDTDRDRPGRKRDRRNKRRELEEEAEAYNRGRR